MSAEDLVMVVGQIARDLVLRVEKVPSLAALAAGPDGNAIVWPGGSMVLPLTGGPATDTTGAGDTFVAALVAALARGDGPADAGRRAVAAAGQTVAHLGGRPRLVQAT